MGEFLKRHEYLIVWVLSLVIIGALAILIFQLNTIIPNPGSSDNAPVALSNVTPSVPQPTGITMTIQTSATGNSFVMQWENLPNGTVALDVFRGKTGTDPATWSLWKSIPITTGELMSGNNIIGLGNDTEAGYSFYAEAVSGDGNGDASGTSGNTGTVLWVSSSSIPETEPTPPSTASSEPEQSPPNNPSGQNNGTNGNTSSSNATSSNPITNPGVTPSGTAYYNPEIQITGYGSLPGSFWVSRLDGSIQIGWQNIPSAADTITVARSATSTGPWSTILIQHDPGTSGSYTIGLVDSDVNNPDYYQFSALEGTTTIATYGPVYLAGD